MCTQEGGPRVGRASVNRLSDSVAHGASHGLRAYVFLHWIWVPSLVGYFTASDGLRAEAPVDEHVPEKGEEGGDARRREPARESRADSVAPLLVASAGKRSHRGWHDRRTHVDMIVSARRRSRSCSSDKLSCLPPRT